MAQMNLHSTKSEHRQDETQSITLLVDGIAIPIEVPRSEEPYCLPTARRE